MNVVNSITKTYDGVNFSELNPVKIPGNFGNIINYKKKNKCPEKLIPEKLPIKEGGYFASTHFSPRKGDFNLDREFGSIQVAMRDYQEYMGNYSTKVGCNPGDKKNENINYLYCDPALYTFTSENINNSGYIIDKETTKYKVNLVLKPEGILNFDGTKNFVNKSEINILENKLQEEYPNILFDNGGFTTTSILSSKEINEINEKLNQISQLKKNPEYIGEVWEEVYNNYWVNVYMNYTILIENCEKLD